MRLFKVREDLGSNPKQNIELCVRVCVCVYFFFSETFNSQIGDDTEDTG